MTQVIMAYAIVAYQAVPTTREMTNAWGSFGLALAFLISGIAWIAYDRYKLGKENDKLHSTIEEMWESLLESEKERSKQVESNVKAMQALNEHLENRLKEQDRGVR
jgi:hypothetical protein